MCALVHKCPYLRYVGSAVIGWNRVRMGNRIVQKWFRRRACRQTPQPETLGPEFGSYQVAFSLPEIDFVFFADNPSVFPGQV